MGKRSWWKPAVCLACCFVVFQTLPTRVQSSGLMVTAPRVWMTGSEERMCIVPHDLTHAVLCNISLISQDEIPKIFANRSIVLQPGNNTCLGISVPKNISSSRAKVVVSAEAINSRATYSFSKSAGVSIKSATQMTFIQTDKPIYKPGDLVKIRILTLGGVDLKVLLDDVSLVYIEDPSRTRVMQWLKVSAINGLSSLEMQLSDEPRLGAWTIKAVIGDKTESQSFAVEEYVLPKYEVIIDHPSYMVRPSNASWKVCARYTYGQPVSGEVKSKLCLRHDYFGEDRSCVQPIAAKLKDGCAEFFAVLQNVSESHHYWSLSGIFSAEVKERGTGVKMNSTLTASVQLHPYKLNFVPEDSRSSHYKPGLPYHGQGQVTFPDDTPAKGVVVKLTTTAKKKKVPTATLR